MMRCASSVTAASQPFPPTPYMVLPRPLTTRKQSTESSASRAGRQGLPSHCFWMMRVRSSDTSRMFRSRSGRLPPRFGLGPLTIVLRKSHLVSDKLTAGRDTVGLRVPDHRLPRYISKSLEKAITGTSANLSGSPSLTTAQEVEAQLGDAVDLVIDGGPACGTTASTVVDLSGDTPTILREGSITLEDIEKAIRRA